MGLGLKMMRYRAQMLGGDLVLEKSAEGGVVRALYLSHRRVARP